MIPLLGADEQSIDHYVGPGIITKHLGTRSIVIRYKEKDFQRDAGMIMLERPRPMDVDPTIEDRLINEPRLQIEAIRNDIPYREGEFVILKDDPKAETWYCAEIRKILADRIEVKYYTTATSALPDYRNHTIIEKQRRLKAANFLRTWCLDRGRGLPTTTPPTSNHGRMKHLWWGRIPLEDVEKHILVRNIGISALGKLDEETVKLAAQLNIPHHEGAGGENDFVDKEAFQKHTKRVSKRINQKRNNQTR
jgi:hypothetical protein